MSNFAKYAASALLVGALAACSGADTSTSVEAAEPAAAASSVAPSVTPTPTPTPTPIDLKATLVTAKDLPGPWKRDSIARDRGAGECHKAGLPGSADASQVAWGSFHEDKKSHAAQLGLGLVELDPADVAAYGKAVEKESDSCNGKSVYGWYGVSSTDDPPTVDGAEVVASFRQRFYADKKHTQFLYVRQGLVLDKGGVLIHIENAFVPESAKDKGKSFEPTLAIADAQLAKIN